MKKKILLIIAAIFVLTAITFWIITKSQKSPTGQGGATPPTSNPAELPSGTENSQQNIQSVETKIQNTSNSPSSQQAIQSGIESVDFKDARGNVIPLSDFEKATDISIVSQLRAYLDNQDYRMFYCPSVGNTKDYAVYFGYNVSKAYVNLYPDTLQWMKSWEGTMLKDLHSVLFPNVNFSDAELNQSLQFKDGKYRYTEIRLPGGKMGSINYRISLNGVIITASSACLDKMIQIYEPYQP